MTHRLIHDVQRCCFSPSENCDKEWLFFFFLPPTLNNVALFLCRCHAICHCYPDWLEDSMPSSVVPCHSLLRLHHIISGSGIHPRRAKLEACHGVSVYCSASVIGFTDNVIVVQEPADPSHPPPSFSLPCTPASCLPPLLMAADEKWPGTRKKETRYREPTHSAWNIVFTFKWCQFTA